MIAPRRLPPYVSFLGCFSWRGTEVETRCCMRPEGRRLPHRTIQMRQYSQPDQDRTSQIKPPWRILVAEDDFLIALALIDQLETGGYEVVGPAVTSEKALELIKHERIDAGVLDVDLGGAPSFPVAQALTRRETPFLFATGQRRADLIPEFRNCPLLSKPVAERSLLVAVAKLLKEKISRTAPQAPG